MNDNPGTGPNAIRPFVCEVEFQCPPGHACANQAMVRMCAHAARPLSVGCVVTQS